MKTEKPSPPKTISLEQVLQRGDVWRGHSQHLVPQAALDTGCTDLNVILVNRGWPLASLIEVCLPMASKTTASVAISQGEWLLIAPALRQVKEGYTVLLNPPAIPFAPGLIQIGMDLDRLIVVETKKKSDFLASFIELARSDICTAVMAWQPAQNFNYTELRKCQLACSDGKGLYLLFRPLSTMQQSSPAALRLSTKIQADSLEIHIFKQKGRLARNAQQSIHLPLPTFWLPFNNHKNLGLNNRDFSPNDKGVSPQDLKRSQS